MFLCFDVWPAALYVLNQKYNNKILILLNTDNMSFMYLNFMYFCKLIFN